MVFHAGTAERDGACRGVRRTGAERDRAGDDIGRSAPEAGLCDGRPDRLARRVLPPRYRLAGAVAFRVKSESEFAASQSARCWHKTRIPDAMDMRNALASPMSQTRRARLCPRPPRHLQNRSEAAVSGSQLDAVEAFRALVGCEVAGHEFSTPQSGCSDDAGPVSALTVRIVGRHPQVAMRPCYEPIADPVVGQDPSRVATCGRDASGAGKRQIPQYPCQMRASQHRRSRPHRRRRDRRRRRAPASDGRGRYRVLLRAR